MDCIWYFYMSVYELFFNALIVEVLVIAVAYFLFVMWQLIDIIFDDTNGYGFNIFDEMERQDAKIRNLGKFNG